MFNITVICLPTPPTYCCYNTLGNKSSDTCKLKPLGLLLRSLKHNKFNCAAKLVQVQLLQQMFEMSSFFLHSGPKSLPPFVDSIISDSPFHVSVKC